MTILFCGVAFGQHLIRVNNNPGADADYTTLQEANDNASDGDTIYVEGSTEFYAGADISRQLTIIGPGYFLCENETTQAYCQEAKFNGLINFMAGSEGSILTGCNVSSSIYINVDDITVSRCQVSQLTFNDAVENILILQNYAYTISTSSNGSIANSIIANNYVKNRITTSYYSGAHQIINNVVEGSSSGYNIIDAYNASISNNILCHTNGIIAENSGNTITNNLMASDGTDANGNLYNVSMANVFVDFSGTLEYSTDGKWQLKAGSPAIGAGVAGVDCGMFGGVTAYVLSGLPDLPHIYEAAIPGTASSGEGLPVTIKVKSGQ
jgi:hypothetical protein